MNESEAGMRPRRRKSFPELMRFAGKHRYLTYASWLFSAASAALALVPFCTSGSSSAM